MLIPALAVPDAAGVRYPTHGRLAGSAICGTRLYIARWCLDVTIDWRFLMSLGTILLIILVIALLGGFSGIGGGPFYGTGYYGGGGLGLVLVIVLILVLLGRI
jgi:Protein of unknown function (DUF3309)